MIMLYAINMVKQPKYIVFCNTEVLILTLQFVHETFRPIYDQNGSPVSFCHFQSRYLIRVTLAQLVSG